MTDLGPIRQLPIACSLPADAGAEQLARWREYDADYALSRETAPGIVTVHYAKNEDSIERLASLVSMESRCCSFVSWQIDGTHRDLRLVVTGADDALAALRIA